MFEPSDYQKRIFEWFQKPDGPIAINAVAGSGKTTSLVMGFQQLRSPGTQLFAAFNTSIVAELKKRLPSTVNCQTIHSLGYATLRKAFPDAKWDLENGNIKYRKMARDIEVDRKNQTQAQFDQEMNLRYVAITRAKNELYFVTPDPNMTEDNNRYRNPGIPGMTL